MDKKYHKRKIGTLKKTEEETQTFELDMKNDSLFLFNKLADVMTLLIDHGTSSSISVQRKLNDKLVRIITGDQYNDFIVAYQKTFGKKWVTYKEEETAVKKSEDKNL